MLLGGSRINLHDLLAQMLPGFDLYHVLVPDTGTWLVVHRSYKTSSNGMPDVKVNPILILCFPGSSL